MMDPIEDLMALLQGDLTAKCQGLPASLFESADGDTLELDEQQLAAIRTLLQEAYDDHDEMGRLPEAKFQATNHGIIALYVFIKEDICFRETLDGTTYIVFPTLVRRTMDW